MDTTRDFSVYTDEHIVDTYWRRDEEAIVLTDGKYGKYLYKLAYNVLHEDDDSRSVLDDTYLGAWNSIPPERPTGLLLYLSKIARRAAIDLFRRSHAKKRVRGELITSLDELAECISCGVDTECDVGELSELLNAYLSRLDSRRRSMFVARYFYSDSVEDIARALSVGPSYVYRELSAMRRELADYLCERGYDV